MTISGDLLSEGTSYFGGNARIRGIDALTGEALPGEFRGASAADVEQAVRHAVHAFPTYRESSLEARAAFLESIADHILDIGDELIVRCVAESGLPRPRIEGERGRTVGQLRLFAQVVRQGAFLGARIDPAQAERQPMPRVDLRLRNIPLGTVAVFGASNFPLAFSVAGGDTASALAAGCPVIVKAHSAHPGTSELVGRAIRQAVAASGFPSGVFSLMFDAGYEVGQALVAHPDVCAVGFTGSRAGGLALMKIAAARTRPIPVYAEMSSINPVILFPVALQARGAAIGKAFVGALTMGAGQFCTNPGLVIGVDGDGLAEFLRGAGEALTQVPTAPMLTPGIYASYCAGVERFAGHDQVELVARGVAGAERQAQAALFSTSAETFLADRKLQDEVFGPVSLVVRARDWKEVQQVIDVLEGQLSVALHMDAADTSAARQLLPKLEYLAGRILVNGFGTGVEVGHAMVHGGPFPATSDGRTTSVGSLAIDRFLRLVSYQDFPDQLLPPPVQDANPLNIRRSIDGPLG